MEKYKIILGTRQEIEDIINASFKEWKLKLLRQTEEKYVNSFYALLKKKKKKNGKEIVTVEVVKDNVSCGGMEHVV